MDLSFQALLSLKAINEIARKQLEARGSGLVFAYGEWNLANGEHMEPIQERQFTSALIPHELIVLLKTFRFYIENQNDPYAIFVGRNTSNQHLDMFLLNVIYTQKPDLREIRGGP